MNSSDSQQTTTQRRKKTVTAPQDSLIRKLNYEIERLDNMQKRVSLYTTRLSYCSYVDRILQRLEGARNAMKDLKNRVMYSGDSDYADSYRGKS